MKRFTFFILSIFLFVSVFSGCSFKDESKKDTSKLNVVTTIFPPYDFVREISGGLADVNMLLKPGMESHSYEPSPADIIMIENCDIFIYNGGESDTWVDEILKTVDISETSIIKMMDCVNGLEEEFVEGMQGGHNHSGEHHQHEEETEHNHTYRYDEHIWTSPQNAILIAKEIGKVMIEKDSINSNLYIENLEKYINKLKELDNRFSSIVNNSSQKTMIFGDRFPFRYFADCYGLSYYAAFPGCSAQAEPSAKTVAYLINKIKEENIKHIFYIEFSNQKITNALQEEAGAKPLLFHSCHNLSKDEMEENMTYLGMMNRNADTLEEAFR